ncbi:MAG: acyl-ACP--UDP-N-acetylglucosamine O-acyltransferase [Zetaproteobacteria bacterium]|nr:MAG: acyl-ACP--UDP-N-acetylglucosamine O-acyltransferase [Zetaproteobacteria bacterium]
MNSSRIHPTAIVSPEAELAADVIVGPWCVIDGPVRIGSGCRLISHVVLSGRTTIGADNRFFPFSSVGLEPQDLKYRGEPSEVVIGCGNTIREHATIHAGTEGGGMVTRIGDGNLIMAYAHVAHDCWLGNRIVLANAATLAGHVTIEDDAIIGGLSAVHQFLRIGRLAMIGGMSGIVQDVPPFTMIAGGYRPGLAGLNLVGLQRKGFDAARIRRLKQVYRALFQRDAAREERIAAARAAAGDDEAAGHMVDFVAAAERGVTWPRGTE